MRTVRNTYFAFDLVQMGSRVYIPTMGRFLSVDPIEGGVDNNYVDPPDPVNDFDLDGTFIETGLDVAGLAYDINVFKKNRSLGNAGFLIWSAASIALPGVPGSWGARTGGKIIKGYTKHGIDQAISRDGVGVATKAILSAAKNPQRIIKQSGGRVMYRGKDAVVVLNKYGKIITTWALNTRGWRLKK